MNVHMRQIKNEAIYIMQVAKSLENHKKE